MENLYAIYAGVEPESFIELFPYWIVKKDVTHLQIDVRLAPRGERGTYSDSPTDGVYIAGGSL